MPLSNKFLAFGSLGGMSAIIFDALSSHGVSDKIGPPDLAFIQLAIDYQLYNSLCLLIIGVLCKMSSIPKSLTTLSGLLLAAGILVFCGSLYVKGLFETELISYLTPLGGLLLILGWGCLFLASLSVALSRD